MEKIKFGLFDVFVYLLPGFVVLSCMFLVYFELNIQIKTSVKNLILVINNFNFYSITLFTISSYIIGFVFHSCGYFYFVVVGKRLWYNKRDNLEGIPMSFERKISFVRHYSQENFKYIEQWYTFRGMSFNLSLAFLILFFTLIIKIILGSFYKIDWLIITISCLLFSIILLKRAITFHKWSHDTLYETIKFLKLEGNMAIPNNSIQVENGKNIDVTFKKE